MSKGRYSKVSRRKWVDEKIRRLSPPPPSGFTLFDRFLTGPELTNVPGLFTAWEAGLAQALGWSLDAFRYAFEEVYREGLAEADWSAGLVWVPNAIKHNEPESLNVVIGWENTLADLPDCELKTKALKHLEAWCKAKGEAWAKAWAKACPIQEQEQEQEQEQRESAQANPDAAPPSAPAEPPPPPVSMAIQSGARRFAESFDSEAPDELEFTDEHKDFASRHGIDLAETWLACRDYRRAKRYRCANWPAEFMAWLRREAKFRREKPTNGRPPRGPRQPSSSGGFGAAFLDAAGGKTGT